jgi:3-hydroxyethyl bacteriochlorophyllide a dehydrogenase
VVVDIAWSGISTGTERLLWQGRMPPFPGMGYPLVPGYESVGRIIAAGPDSAARMGEAVFVPGANCFGAVRGLFGGAAGRLVVPVARALSIDPRLGERGVLLALAATAYHAIMPPDAAVPDRTVGHAGVDRIVGHAGVDRIVGHAGVDRIVGHAGVDLIVGHGVLGRLLARLVVQAGFAPPMVWETDPDRRTGAVDYAVTHPEQDNRRDYRCICDASGDPAILDALIARLAPGGEIVLAGFYADRLSFAFPPAFMREARLRVAAEFRPADLVAVCRLVEQGRLSLDGLITHRMDAAQAAAAYRTAFSEPACLKMILDWRASA